MLKKPNENRNLVSFAAIFTGKLNCNLMMVLGGKFRDDQSSS